VSTDSTKVVQIFGYFQEKRFRRALEHLALAYESNLTTEEEVLKALEQVGWDEDTMTQRESILCEILREKAEFLRLQGQQIRSIMRDVGNYEDSEESSDPFSDEDTEG
jgi:hypothetical protein